MAKEYIERNAVLDALYDNEYTTLCPLDEVISIICAIPAADVAEVVRCKNCHHSRIDDYTGKRLCRNPMGCYGCVPTKEDSFCSHGERTDNHV